jgi:proline dehydrogenase
MRLALNVRFACQAYQDPCSKYKNRCLSIDVPIPILMFRAPFHRFSNFIPVRPPPYYRLLNTRGYTKDALLTRRTAARLSVGTLLTASSIFLVSTVYGDSASDEPEQASRKHTRPTFGSLIRAYTVYSLCSVPVLVDASPKILSALSSVPVIRQITEAFVRVTFFDQVRHFDTSSWVRLTSVNICNSS